MVEKPHSNSEVFVSNPAWTVELNMTAVLLQPTSSNLHYAAEALPLPAPTPTWKIHEIDTDYHPGFDLGIRGIFHKTNTNLSLNWERIRSTDSASKEIPSSDMLGPFFEIGPDASPYNKARGKVSFDFDEANLTFGIFMNLGDRLETNLFTGVEFARIKQTLLSKFSNPKSNIDRSIKVPSTFIGAGPELGLEFAYRIVAGFHLTGKTRAALLVGTQKNHTSYKSDSPLLAGLGIDPPNEQGTTVPNRTQIVPAFEAGLGFSYVFHFCKHYMAKLEAGYQVQTYRDAIQSVDMGSEVIELAPFPDSVGVYARTFQQNLSSFTLAGPYFTFVLGF